MVVNTVGIANGIEDAVPSQGLALKATDLRPHLAET